MTVATFEYDPNLSLRCGYLRCESIGMGAISIFFIYCLIVYCLDTTHMMRREDKDIPSICSEAPNKGLSVYCTMHML